MATLKSKGVNKYYEFRIMRHLRVDVLSSHWPRRWPGWTSVKRRSNRSEVHRPLVDVDLEQENSIKNLPMAHRPDLKLQKKICDIHMNHFIT